MKKALTLILALIMVFTAISVTSVSSFAAGTTKVSMSYGNVYGAPGKIVHVPMYIAADSVDEAQLHIRQIEIYPSVTGGASVVPDSTQFKNVLTGGSPFGYYNETSGKYGVTSDTGKSFATRAQVLAMGGAPITYVPVQVPADAVVGTVYTVNDTNAETFIGFEDKDRTTYNYHNTTDFTCTAGSVTVVAGTDGVFDKVPVTSGTYRVPEKDAAGKVITSIDSGAFNGFTGTVVIPANVNGNIDFSAFMGGTIENLVVKNANITALPAGIMALVNMQSSPFSIYYLNTANGMNNATKGTLTNGTSGKANITLKNILVGQSTELKVEGHSVTAYGGIAIRDLGYESIVTELVFSQGGKVVKTKRYATNTVYTTLQGVASCDAETAAAQGIDQFDGSFLTGLTVNNVPVGDYDVTLTIYAKTPDSDGNGIWVSSDAQAFTVSIK